MSIRETRRAELLEHARSIVREGGLSALTMKKVAARVGFTEAAAYRYFPNKEALLLGLAEGLSARLLEPLRALAGSDGPPGERLQQMVQHHVDFVLAMDGLPILVLVEAAMTDDAAMLEQLADTIGGYLDVVAAVLGDLPHEGPRPRPRDLALTLLGIPASLAILRRVLPDAEVERRVRDEVVPYVLSKLA